MFTFVQNYTNVVHAMGTKDGVWKGVSHPYWTGVLREVVYLAGEIFDVFCENDAI